MSLTARVDEYLDRNGLEAVWFARPNSFAWLTGGERVGGHPADNVVDGGGDIGVAAAGYDGQGVTVVTDDIEAQRLREEELDGSVAVETFPWYETTLANSVADVSERPAAADFDVPGFETVDATPLRQPLTDPQCERYRELSRDVASEVETVARGTGESDSERAVAARLRERLAAADIGAPVVLVGGQRRARRYRHYTPTDAPLGGYALLSVTARRGGLYTSCTRTVAFDPPEWLRERTRAAMRVAATSLAATQAVARDGGTAGGVFSAIQRAYDEVGWDGEWTNHHQGGAAGFAGREWIATPESEAQVHIPQAYAWNPTVQGAKSEDTYLVTESDAELLSGTGDWPMTSASAVDYDRAYPCHAPLER